MKTITVRHIEIGISELHWYDDIAFNPEGDNYTHQWEHIDGLGFVSPSSGLGHSEDDCIKQATEAVESSFGR